MKNQADIFSSGWCDLVFENRNKEYGAYLLRRIYAKNAFFAVLISITFFVFLACIPNIIKLFSSKSIVDVLVPKMDTIIFTNVVIPNKPEPVEIPSSPRPQVKSVVDASPKVVSAKQITDVTLPEINKGSITNLTGRTDTVESTPPPSKGYVNPPEPVEIKVEKATTYAEFMPEFPGGETAMIKFLTSNIKYPQMPKENGIVGTVYCSFIIDTIGNVTEVSIARSVRGLDQEAMRVIKSMPRWKPGKQSGRTVRVQYTLPIKFTLN